MYTICWFTNLYVFSCVWTFPICIQTQTRTSRINIACFSHSRAQCTHIDTNFTAACTYTWIFTGMSFSICCYYRPFIRSICLNQWEWIKFWTWKWIIFIHFLHTHRRKKPFEVFIFVRFIWIRSFMIAVQNFVDHWRRRPRSFAFHRFIFIFMSCLGVSRNHMFEWIGWLVGVLLRLKYGLKTAWQCLHLKKIYSYINYILMVTMARKRESERWSDQMVCVCVREGRRCLHSYTERPSCMFMYVYFCVCDAFVEYMHLSTYLY